MINIDFARGGVNNDDTFKLYKTAFEGGNRYWDIIEENECLNPDIPKRNELLTYEDAKKLCEIHYYYLKSMKSRKKIRKIEQMLDQMGYEEEYQKSQKNGRWKGQKLYVSTMNGWIKK